MHEVGSREVGNMHRLTWSAMVINKSSLYGTSAVVATASAARFRSSVLGAADPASHHGNNTRRTTEDAPHFI